MSATIVPQSQPSRNPSIALVPADSLGADQIPSLIQVAGQTVHAPLIEGDTLIIDTGSQILDFNSDEIAVLRLVLTSLDRAPEVA